MDSTRIYEGTDFASTDEVLSFLGTDRCRLVYRVRREKNLQGHGERANDRAKGSSLFLLDYMKGKPYPDVHHFPGDPVYTSFAPMLSPDGTKILYNHTFDASDILILPVGGGSPVGVAFGANPHWCYDRETENMYIVFRNKNGKFDNVPQDGITYRLRIDGDGTPIGNPEAIAAYGFGGGMSSNGRYLCSAYLLPVAMDRQTGAISAPLGTVRLPGSVNQCCCPSIAPDDTGRMMVLRWPHSRFSVMGWDGSDLAHYPVPEGADEWQTPEWSTHPDFATGSIMNKEFLYDIVLIRLSDMQYLKVTRDGGYVHAHLWVG